MYYDHGATFICLCFRWAIFFGRVFVCFSLYWCLLCSVLCAFISIPCLIFLAARYLKVFCIFTSGYLMVFSVSTISALMKCFGFFLWCRQILNSKYLFLTEFYLYPVYKSCMEAMFHCFFVMENGRFVSL